MIENYPKGLEAQGSFSLAHRVTLQLLKGFPVFLNGFEYAKRACLEDGTGFVSARIPRRFWSHEQSTRTMMFRMVKLGSLFRVHAIPGIHDVTGYVNNGLEEDPYANFRSLLLKNFRAQGEFNNIFLLDTGNAFSRFNEVQYDPPLISGQISSSQIEAIKGDRYRLLLWTGFTRNCEPRLASNGMGVKLPYAYGTVDNTPAALIDRFIVINTRDFPQSVEERVQFYREDTRDCRPLKPVRILNSEYKQIATL